MQFHSPRPPRRRRFRLRWLLLLVVLSGGGFTIAGLQAVEAPDPPANAGPGRTTPTLAEPLSTQSAPLPDGDGAAAPAAEPAATAGPGSLTINLVGDIQLAEVPGPLLGEAPPYGFDRVAALVRDADLTFANLECPVTGRGSAANKTFAFRAEPWRLAALTRWGVDAVGLANNHVADFGPAALADTLRQLDAAGLPHTGAGLTRAEAVRPVILERNGVTVAYLAFSDVVPGEAAPYLCRPGEEQLRRGIAAARGEHGADIVIVALHMGVERQELTPRQVALGRMALAAGADIVHGHHPHCLLGFERTDRGLIAYSMGNFLFGHSGRSFRDTGLLRITVRNKRVAAARIIPLRDKDGPGNCYIPLIPDGDNRARIISVLDGYSRRTNTRVAADGAITARE